MAQLFRCGGVDNTPKKLYLYNNGVFNSTYANGVYKFQGYSPSTKVVVNATNLYKSFTNTGSDWFTTFSFTEKQDITKYNYAKAKFASGDEVTYTIVHSFDKSFFSFEVQGNGTTPCCFRLYQNSSLGDLDKEYKIGRKEAELSTNAMTLIEFWLEK